jgi:hypothetical protein
MNEQEITELEDIVVRPYKLKKLEQAINEVKLSGITTSFKAMGRMLWLYFTKHTTPLIQIVIHQE